MKIKIKIKTNKSFSIALLAFAWLLASCDNAVEEDEVSSGFTSAGQLGTYLASQPVNTAATPYKVALSGIDISQDGVLSQIFAVFNSRYVELDLRACKGVSIPDPGSEERQGEEFLTGVIFTPNLRDIGDYAFAYCVSLKKLVFPRSLRSIGEYAFSGCAALTSITLPDSVESIGAYSFRNCAALASFTLPASLARMGNGVFEDCDALTECRINTTTPPAGLTSAPFARNLSLQAITFSTITGLREFKENSLWNVYDSKMTVEGIPASMVGGMEIYFDTGFRRTDTANSQTPSCAAAAGTNLVLAPVKWNVPAGATFAWTVDGAAVTAGEYFTLNRPAGTYTVTCTVTAGIEIASASINVNCVQPAPERPATGGSRANATRCFGFSPAAGQFTGVYPALTNSAASSEEEWRQKAEARLNGTAIPMGPYYDGWSLQHMGYIIAGFDHSIVKRSQGGELRIPGNDFGGQQEPGIVSVMQDVNGNGLPDDVWYELKGSLHTTANGWSTNEKPRYAKTYFRPAVAGANPSWIDNQGAAGVADGPYPFFTNSEYITYSGTALVVQDTLPVSKYVDAGSIVVFNIADAVQADGSAANLQYIDFVRVHSARGGAGGGGTGSYSTELSAIQDNSLVPPPVLTGTAQGGQYSYTFENSSGYPIEIKVWQTNGTAITGSAPDETFTLNAGLTVNKTYVHNKVALEYTGGNTTISVTGNRAVFTATGGDGGNI